MWAMCMDFISSNPSLAKSSSLVNTPLFSEYMQVAVLPGAQCCRNGLHKSTHL